jgi:hypothetical protein
MERFLLINNKNFFDRHNVYTVKNVNDIPNRNSILFIGSHECSIDNLNNITKYFDTIKKKNFQYIIIVGKGDGKLNKDITIPDNIKYIYANNTNFEHDKIKFLPMGCDFRSIPCFSIANLYHNKAILCYCNFSLNTHSDRKKVYNMVENKSFITIKNMQTFLNYSISREKFFKHIGMSKFVICPRGNAIDTFRFYDTIYSGAIPIVVKEQYHDSDFFKEVPILYLKDINEFNDLTEEFLNKKYDELIKYRKEYYQNLDFDFFIKNLSFLF